MPKDKSRTEQGGELVMPIRIRRYRDKVFIGIAIPVEDPVTFVETRGLVLMAMAYKFMLEVRKLVRQSRTK